ncbi:MAG: glycosyltransferase family 4 protein [Vampirovibrionales bacterium]|nr:glycosyltransferase family 4 protein [Vampirovibrionales bacterium]
MGAERRLIRAFYVCHDGDLFGSQQSLAIMAAHARDFDIAPVVSIARPGPLTARLASIPGLTLATHRRLQWFKHDQRSGFQRVGDAAGLLASAWPRARALAALLRAHRADVVHSNSLVSLEGALAARLAGIPHVWHIRELFVSDNPKLRPTLGADGVRRVVEAFSTRILCISQAVAAQFSQEATARLVVMPNAVAMAANQTPVAPLWPPAEGRLRVGYVGRLTAGKRFGDLIEALAILGDATPIELVVAGKFVDAPYEAFIRARLDALGVGDRVRLLGVLDDLRPFYAGIDALALPSKDEPFGRALIEAMAAGAPCIGADSGGIPEIIAHERTGLLYPCGDARALAAALARYWREPDLRRTLANNAGRAAAQRFTIETQMQALRAVYDAALTTAHR